MFNFVSSYFTTTTTTSSEQAAPPAPKTLVDLLRSDQQTLSEVAKLAQDEFAGQKINWSGAKGTEEIYVYKAKVLPQESLATQHAATATRTFQNWYGAAANAVSDYTGYEVRNATSANTYEVLKEKFEACKEHLRQVEQYVSDHPERSDEVQTLVQRIQTNAQQAVNGLVNLAKTYGYEPAANDSSLPTEETLAANYKASDGYNIHSLHQEIDYIADIARVRLEEFEAASKKGALKFLVTSDIYDNYTKRKAAFVNRWTPDRDPATVKFSELVGIYRKTALRLHPDRNPGNEEQFKCLSNQWEWFIKYGTEAAGSWEEMAKLLDRK